MSTGQLIGLLMVFVLAAIPAMLLAAFLGTLLDLPTPARTLLAVLLAAGTAVAVVLCP